MASSRCAAWVQRISDRNDKAAGQAAAGSLEFRPTRDARSATRELKGALPRWRRIVPQVERVRRAWFRYRPACLTLIIRRFAPLLQSRNTPADLLAILGLQLPRSQLCFEGADFLCRIEKRHRADRRAGVSVHKSTRVTRSTEAGWDGPSHRDRCCGLVLSPENHLERNCGRTIQRGPKRLRPRDGTNTYAGDRLNHVSSGYWIVLHAMQLCRYRWF